MKEGKTMDTLKIGRYIQHLRKAAGMTQKDLAEKLNISFQAVSKWENGDSLPDTGILPDLCDILNTTADKLLNGGQLTGLDRRLMRLEDVITGFENLESIGRLFGEDCTFFTGMIEGINEKMNMDLLPYLKDPMTREVMYAEVLIQGILSGRTVDMDEIEAGFQNKKMVETIRRYLAKTNGPRKQVLEKNVRKTKKPLLPG
ncbi:MAG: helix-turn-helix transcriptional regulator [Clostridia bacterium]|nr:helix-turn-helix transcriptional regulator [Clostridia bacterium]